MVPRRGGKSWMGWFHVLCIYLISISACGFDGSFEPGLEPGSHISVEPQEALGFVPGMEMHGGGLQNFVIGFQPIIDGGGYQYAEQFMYLWRESSAQILQMCGLQSRYVHLAFLCLVVIGIMYNRCRKRVRKVNRLSRHGLRLRCMRRLQLRATILVFMVRTSQAMEAGSSQQAGAGNMQEILLTRLAELAQAATSAAVSADNAVRAQAAAQGTTGDGSFSAFRGLGDASRILKCPDTFSGEDAMCFPQWKLQFTSWLGFGDTRFVSKMAEVEAESEPPHFEDYTVENKDLAVKLHAILTSYLRGRCSQLVRASLGTRDGFWLWRALNQQFMPHTRQRSLALATAISNYPAFSGSKSVLENVLQLEHVIDEYESASGNTYPSGLKRSTLPRCCRKELRDHLQLNMRADTSYETVREAILNYDRVTSVWSSDKVLKQLEQNPLDRPGEPSASSNGVAPMEVDRVEDKGNHKGGGKWHKGSKGKGAGWGSAGAGWWQKGKGAKGKGKRKGGGKKGYKGQGKKGKSNGKGKKGGKQKGLERDVCRICGGTGHWGNECPQRQVRAVQEQTSGQESVGYGSTYAPSTASYNPSQAAPSYRSDARQPVQQPQVRRVNLYHIATPPETVPEIYELHSDAGDDDEFYSIRMVSDVSANVSKDCFYDWLDGRVFHPNEQCAIRAVSHVPGDHAGDWIILDSGADVSLLPNSYGDVGIPVTHRNLQLEDAQGGSLAVAGMRRADVHVLGINGQSTVINEEFVLSNVTSVLLSLGRLMRQGWMLQSDGSGTVGEGTGVSLVSPDRSVTIPVVYRRNSLAISAKVCSVQMVHGPQRVRAVATVTSEIESGKRGSWQLASDGTPYLFTMGTNFVDPRYAWGKYWPYRTTCVRQGNSGVVEMAEIYIYGGGRAICSDSSMQFTGVSYLDVQRGNPHHWQSVMEFVSEEVNQTAREQQQRREEPSSSSAGSGDVSLDVFPHESGVPMELASSRFPWCEQSWDKAKVMGMNCLGSATGVAQRCICNCKSAVQGASWKRAYLVGLLCVLPLSSRERCMS